MEFGNLNPSFLHKALKVKLWFTLPTLHLLSWHSVTTKGKWGSQIDALQETKALQSSPQPSEVINLRVCTAHSGNRGLRVWSWGSRTTNGMWLDGIRKAPHQELTQFWYMSACRALPHGAVMTTQQRKREEQARFTGWQAGCPSRTSQGVCPWCGQHGLVVQSSSVNVQGWLTYFSLLITNPTYQRLECMPEWSSLLICSKDAFAVFSVQILHPR